MLPENAGFGSAMRFQKISWVLSGNTSPFLEHVHPCIRAGGAELKNLSNFYWARVADRLSHAYFDVPR